MVKDVPYQKGDRHKLDIYIPDQIAIGNPVVVFFYGGSWKEGSKDDYLFVGQAFASRGIIVVIADYRVYPEVYFPSFMDDAAHAYVWTHQHIREYGGNPHNLFLAGHSAGAYNAVMLTLNTAYLKTAGGSDDWIRGTLGIAGPYDFLPLTDPKIIDIFSKQELSTTQPINFVRPHLPPFLLLTGDDDHDVDPRNSHRLAQRLFSKANDVQEIIYPGLGHVGIALALAKGFRGKAPVLNDCVNFILHHTTTG